MATPLEKSITINCMMVTKQPAKISLPTTEIRGAVKYSMGTQNHSRMHNELYGTHYSTRNFPLQPIDWTRTQ